ncbi:hypothetical protein Tco_0269623 [Tanacetum coccineum]
MLAIPHNLIGQSNRTRNEGQELKGKAKAKAEILSVKCCEAFVGLFWEAKHQVSFVRILRLREVARVTARIALEFAPEFVMFIAWIFVECYEMSEEESVEQPRRHDLYGFVDHPQLQQGNPMNEFAPHRLPQSKGNMNGWLIENEEEVERDEVDSDLESTASSKPVWEKTTEDDHDCASRNCLWCSK